MKKIYFYSSLILLFSSCSPRINYVGGTSEPTSQVDVFVDEGAIKKDYDIIGKGYVHGLAIHLRIEKVQSKAIEKARKKGADAVLIQDYYIPNTGTSVSSTARKDSVGKGVVTIRNTNIQSTGDSGFNIYFLKYTR
jgi:hypothetical protein